MICYCSMMYLLCEFFSSESLLQTYGSVILLSRNQPSLRYCTFFYFITTNEETFKKYIVCILNVTIISLKIVININNNNNNNSNINKIKIIIINHSASLDGSMSTSASAGPEFDTRRGRIFSYKNYKPQCQEWWRYTTYNCQIVHLRPGLIPNPSAVGPTYV